MKLGSLVGQCGHAFNDIQTVKEKDGQEKTKADPQTLSDPQAVDEIKRGESPESVLSQRSTIA